MNAVEKSIIGLSNSDPSEYTFLRVDLERDLDKVAETGKNTMPMLFFLGESSSSLWQKAFLDDCIEKHVRTAQEFKSLGLNRCTIAADQDGLFARILSPRFSDWPFEKRLEPLLETFKQVSKVLDEVWVLLTIEELSPGGMDATDGVAAARALQDAGLKTIIVASGTKDFMPLYDRKVTKKKISQEHDFYSREPGLASALWVRHSSTLKIWALLDIDDPVQAQELAELIGLEGIIQKC